MKTLQHIIATLIVTLIVSSATAQSITPGIKIANATVQNKTMMVGNTSIHYTHVLFNIHTSFTSNFSTIEIERSFDNVHYTATIKNVNTFFTTEKNTQVQCTDASTLLVGKKIAFYRVKMVDNYGNTTFSKVTTVGLEG